MTIKNDLNEALRMKSQLDAGGAKIEAHSVQYATESTLTALAAGKAADQAAERSIGAYKDTLASNAENIGSLGKTFAGLDEALGASMR